MCTKNIIYLLYRQTTLFGYTRHNTWFCTCRQLYTIFICYLKHFLGPTFNYFWFCMSIKLSISIRYFDISVFLIIISKIFHKYRCCTIVIHYRESNVFYAEFRCSLNKCINIFNLCYTRNDWIYSKCNHIWIKTLFDKFTNTFNHILPFHYTWLVLCITKSSYTEMYNLRFLYAKYPSHWESIVLCYDV